MPLKCCVPACRGNYDEKEIVSVFQFPIIEEKRKMWLNKIQRYNFEPSASAVVCEKHFDECFIVRIDSVTRPDGSVLIVKRNRPKLTPDAYPSFFGNSPFYFSSDVPTKRKAPDDSFQALIELPAVELKLMDKMDGEDLDFNPNTPTSGIGNPDQTSSSSPNGLTSNLFGAMTRPSLSSDALLWTSITTTSTIMGNDQNNIGDDSKENGKEVSLSTMFPHQVEMEMNSNTHDLMVNTNDVTNNTSGAGIELSNVTQLPMIKITTNSNTNTTSTTNSNAANKEYHVAINSSSISQQQGSSSLLSSSSSSAKTLSSSVKSKSNSKPKSFSSSSSAARPAVSQFSSSSSSSSSSSALLSTQQQKVPESSPSSSLSSSSSVVTNQNNSKDPLFSKTKSQNSEELLQEAMKAKLPSEQLMSQIPLMNSMVRYQLQRLLRIRDLSHRKNPSSVVNSHRPVAVLTAYSVKKVLLDGSSKGSKYVHKLDGKIFYGNYIPVVCEKYSGIIHQDKLYCPGTHRRCVEYEDRLITPFDLLQKAGLDYTANWRAIFRVGDGKSVKMLFDNGKLDFKDHDTFCTGRCRQPPPVGGPIPRPTPSSSAMHFLGRPGPAANLKTFLGANTSTIQTTSLGVNSVGS